jgi:chemotaxis protein CheD
MADASTDRRIAPAPLQPMAGFEHVRRFFDPNQNCTVVKVLPGEIYVSTQDEQVGTVLGSCVSACIHDPVHGVGGMNHFMLPAPADGGGDNWTADSGRIARYGSDAMEQLIAAVLKAGGKRSDLQVKVFGGGRVLPQMIDIGQRNIEFVRRYIARARLHLLAEDLGDVYPRQVQFHPHSGLVRVRKLRRRDDVALVAGEYDYLKQLVTRG